MTFTEQPRPRGEWVEDMKRQGCDFIRAYETTCGLKVISSLDTSEHGTLLHVSFSRRADLPSWEDVKEVKDYFFGDMRDAIMVFPRKELWINLHENCLHLWELPRIPGRSGRWELM